MATIFEVFSDIAAAAHIYDEAGGREATVDHVGFINDGFKIFSTEGKARDWLKEKKLVIDPALKSRILKVFNKNKGQKYYSTLKHMGKGAYATAEAFLASKFGKEATDEQILNALLVVSKLKWKYKVTSAAGQKSEPTVVSARRISNFEKILEQVSEGKKKKLTDKELVALGMLDTLPKNEWDDHNKAVLIDMNADAINASSDVRRVVDDIIKNDEKWLSNVRSLVKSSIERKTAPKEKVSALSPTVIQMLDRVDGRLQKMMEDLAREKDPKKRTTALLSPMKAVKQMVQAISTASGKTIDSRIEEIKSLVDEINDKLKKASDADESADLMEIRDKLENTRDYLYGIFNKYHYKHPDTKKKG